MTAQRSEVSLVICSTYPMLSLLKVITSSIEGGGGSNSIESNRLESTYVRSSKTDY